MVEEIKELKEFSELENFGEEFQIILVVKRVLTKEKNIKRLLFSGLYGWRIREFRAIKHE